MDKQVVIAAYRQGVISIVECAQIIGLDSLQMERILGEIKPVHETQINSMPNRVSSTGSKSC